MDLRLGKLNVMRNKKENFCTSPGFYISLEEVRCELIHVYLYYSFYSDLLCSF